jgi:anhydro-N-acetylmuramic acid kinase
MLQQNLSETRILTTDEFGINCDSKEAISFAILAYAAIKGIPGNIPTATGADQPLILGKIIPA